MTRAARWWGIGAVAAAAVITAGVLLLRHWLTPHDAAGAELRDHAAIAGNVMTRDAYTLRAIDAAALVAGDVNGTRIDVLRADGTTRGGRVVLRIDVRLQRQDATLDRAYGCFEYRFAQYIGSGATPRRLGSCPTGSPLALPGTPPPGVGTTERGRVVTALQTLSPNARLDPTAVRRAVSAALGPRFFVSAAAEDTGVFVRVASGDQCVTARTDAASVTASPPAHGTDCRGG